MSDRRSLDERFTRHALALGRRHLGLTWPNPSVGAVVVRPDTGVVVATGITQSGGRPHAEPVALAVAGEGARGATLYVSLEPCSHHGRTPPCADAAVEAGIARVVAPLSDPDGRVAGRGFAVLRAAGVAVVTGLCASEAESAHRGHVMRVRSGRPFVTVKLARTPDGFAAAATGPRLRITGEAANASTHLARHHADAVAVGIGTVLADDPRLDVRLPGLERRRPVRVVFDTGLRLPPDAGVVRSAGRQPTWVICGARAPAEAEDRLRQQGVEVLRVSHGHAGRLDPAEALRALAGRGLTSLFCEGGPALADALASADLVDEAVLLTGAAPLGRDGVPALGPHLAARLGGGLVESGRETLGPDTLVRYERRPPCSPAS